MTGRELRAALHEGRRVYSTAIASDSPMWPNAVCAMRLDFVFLDTEHTARDRFTLSWICRAYQAMGIPPVVRIPSPDPYTACQVLDGGAGGIVCPYVETAEQIRDMVGAVRYRPLKGRRLAEALENPNTMEEKLRTYLENRNAHLTLFLNVESVPAVENLNSLLGKSPGVDGILVGPHDLSCSLGIPEQYDHPRFEEAVRKIISVSRQHKVGVGIHFWENIEQEIQWGKLGANILMHGADIHIVRHYIKRDIDRLRHVFGDVAQEKNVEEDVI